MRNANLARLLLSAYTLGVLICATNSCTVRSEGAKRDGAASLERRTQTVGCLFGAVDTLPYNGFHRNEHFDTPFEANKPFTAEQVTGYRAILDRIQATTAFKALKRFCDSAHSSFEREVLVQVEGVVANGVNQQTLLIVQERSAEGQYSIYSSSSGTIGRRAVAPADVPVLERLFDPAVPSFHDVATDSPRFFITAAGPAGIGQYVIDSPLDPHEQSSLAATSEKDAATRRGIYEALAALERYCR